MITPVNGHLLIEPIATDTFISSSRETYQEIGVVVETYQTESDAPHVTKGDKVYFDSWLAKKYPKEGTQDEYLWLVKWEHITAVEYAERQIPEQPV